MSERPRYVHRIDDSDRILSVNRDWLETPRAAPLPRGRKEWRVSAETFCRYRYQTGGAT